MLFTNQEVLHFLSLWSLRVMGRAPTAFRRPSRQNHRTHSPALPAQFLVCSREVICSIKCPWSQAKVATAERDYAVHCNNSAGCNLCVWKPHFSTVKCEKGQFLHSVFLLKQSWNGRMHSFCGCLREGGCAIINICWVNICNYWKKKEIYLKDIKSTSGNHKLNFGLKNIHKRKRSAIPSRY